MPGGTMTCCITCGQTIPDDLVPAGLVLRNNELRIFRAVKRAGPNGIARAALLAALYADHADGGPEWALQSMRVQIHKLNTKLLSHGLVIRAPKGGAHYPTEYTLRQIGRVTR
jgi:hypothetical protein